MGYSKKCVLVWLTFDFFEAGICSASTEPNFKQSNTDKEYKTSFRKYMFYMFLTPHLKTLNMCTFFCTHSFLGHVFANGFILFTHVVEPPEGLENQFLGNVKTDIFLKKLPVNFFHTSQIC